MKLYIAGEDRVGTDENVFIDILSKRSVDHLKAVIEHYVNVSGLLESFSISLFHSTRTLLFFFLLFCVIQISDFDLEQSIKREMSLDLKRALVYCGELLP